MSAVPVPPAEAVGRLEPVPAAQRADLLAPAVQAFLRSSELGSVALVAPVDPSLADTAALCEAYDVAPEVSANCVVVAGTRAERTALAGCVVLATTRVDVNGVVRRRLDARKASFGDRDTVVAATGMEYGGITPVGLPEDWPLLVDPAVAATPWVVVGSGVRRSKLLLPGEAVAGLPRAEVVAGLAR